MQGLTAGPYHVKLTRRHLLSVPGPIALQVQTRTALDLVDKLERARRRHDQTERVDADKALPLAALLLSQTIESVGVTNCNFNSPTVAILSQEAWGAQRNLGAKKGLDRRGRFSLPRLFQTTCGITSHHDDPDQPARQHRMPQATPGVYLGPRFVKVRRPALGGLRQGCRRADQGTFLRGAPRGFFVGLGGTL
jgi:hypothetical protein